MMTIFYLSGIVAVSSTLMVITRKDAVHALLYLIVSLLAISIVFFSLGAPFIAALEVIIYAGAIMVLFIFVVMMLNLGREAARQESKLLNPQMWLGPALFSIILFIELIIIYSKIPAQKYDTLAISPKTVGVSLFSTYMLGVELAAMLLLAGIVGAYYLGKGKKRILHRYLVNSESDPAAKGES